MFEHLPERTAEATARAMKTLLAGLPETTRKTITLDNGGEFYHHGKLPLPDYFCDPHSPCQRRSSENANGVLRRSLPRKTNINRWSDHDLIDIMGTYDTTLCKCLGYLTPLEAFAKDQGVALEI